MDPYAPTGTTYAINFSTTAPLYVHPSQFQAEKRLRFETREDKCHINLAVCDSSWEIAFCKILEGHPRVISYVKNQGLGLEVPYRMQDSNRTYIPDFIVAIDDGNGRDDPLHLVVEIKGYKGEDAVAKATTMRSYWVPGINNLKHFGRWEFMELSSIDTMKEEFMDFVKTVAKASETCVAEDAAILLATSTPN